MGVKQSRNLMYHNEETVEPSLKEISGYPTDQHNAVNRYGYPIANGYNQQQLNHHQLLNHMMPPQQQLNHHQLNMLDGCNRLINAIQQDKQQHQSMDDLESDEAGGRASNRNSLNSATSNPAAFKRKTGGRSKEAWRNSYFKQQQTQQSTAAVAAASSNGPTKSALFQELLECPICMNLFDNPLVLPCQHTFCKKCIVSLQNSEITENNNNNNNNGNNSSSNQAINCPICRELHNLPNGIESLSANYTMKRLIELEAMAATKTATAEKEAAEKSMKEKSKCFLCQNYGFLKICDDCSYMLCADCVEDPDHDIRIDLKMKSKAIRTSASGVPKYDSSNEYLIRPTFAADIYAERAQMMLMMNSNNNGVSTKLKLILLCHSSAVELTNNHQHQEAASSSSGNKYEVYEDEYGKCTTFSKIGIPANDRVITLKKIIETKFGIACNDQILVYKDNVLKNDLKPLHYYKLKQYSRIHIFDQRDIKENASDDELFGIYQDANLVAAETANNINLNNLNNLLINNNNKQLKNNTNSSGSDLRQLQQPPTRHELMTSHRPSDMHHHNSSRGELMSSSLVAIKSSRRKSPTTTTTNNNNKMIMRQPPDHANYRNSESNYHHQNYQHQHQHHHNNHNNYHNKHFNHYQSQQPAPPISNKKDAAEAAAAYRLNLKSSKDHRLIMKQQQQQQQQQHHKHHQHQHHHSKSDESTESYDYDDDVTTTAATITPPAMPPLSSMMIKKQQQQPYQSSPIHSTPIMSSKHGTSKYSSSSSNKRNDSMSRIRRLDEIFEQKLGIND